jgi:hypothetical protein
MEGMRPAFYRKAGNLSRFPHNLPHGNELRRAGSNPCRRCGSIRSLNLIRWEGAQYR